MAETLVARMRMRMRLALEMGFHKVWTESYNFDVVGAINGIE